MSRKIKVRCNGPERHINEIDLEQQLAREKQHDLDVAFWLLFAGLVAAVLLLVWRRMI